LIVDFITKFLLVVEKDVILVICNRLSKIAYFVATTKKTSVEGLVRLFRDNVQKLHRLPESVIGVLFTNRWTDRTNELRVGIVLEILYRV